ncbi:hypothetical protein [Qipengyuania qiaonensis]|uniref:ParB/Sulfiredoxin domain-containing protein n=1 Tax=Qipengyuania qiaonensis TaxID=2867240 RepID=A0ABS7J7C2_9SPHN|nr:hypothetical protein [Qipengyuania qiaonensis]MBX7482838.1 hypothetical protein [Qipengyuania qiaonensis]
MADIKEERSLFQPRHDSIAYAPGRSEAHVANLAKIAKAGNALDPLTITAFGSHWYLLDGHHRLQAYHQVGWGVPVPVNVLQSDLDGEARVTWAVQESVRDNKKNRLPMSDADKIDAAWSSVARRDKLSKSATAELHGVSERVIGNMRAARKALEAAGHDCTLIVSWSAARRMAEALTGGERDSGASDWEEQQRRRASKKAKGVMEMDLSPLLLGQILEAYSPGIVESMALALKAEQEDTEKFSAWWQSDDEADD